MMYRGRIRRSLKRFRRSTRGGALIELAVVFPIILLLLIGVVDYGRVYYTHVIVANAARAGAEFGSRDPAFTKDIAAMKAFAQADGQEAGTLNLSARQYCECGFAVADDDCGPCPSGRAPEVYVELTATKIVSTLLRYPGLPTAIRVTRTATFRSQ